MRLLLGSGHDLAGIVNGSIDLTVLVDTAPYLLLSEGRIVSRCLAEIARVLRPGGELAIFNFSYRDDLPADRVELERLARAHALALLAVGERPCASWDAPAFHLVKHASSAC